jgi:hypothetical protein
MSNPIDQYSVICTLKAFTPTPTQINDGVKPGDVGFEECVLVNFKAYTTFNECGIGSAVYVMHNTTLATPPYYNINSISLTQPPLIGNEFPHTDPWPA